MNNLVYEQVLFYTYYKVENITSDFVFCLAILQQDF